MLPPQAEFANEETGNIALKAIDKSKASLIVAGNDIIAIGVMTHLHKTGVKIPEEISIIGFDDIPWADIVTPKLTTMRQNVPAIAKESVNLIMDKIGNPNLPTRQVLLDVAIKERESVRSLST